MGSKQDAALPIADNDKILADHFCDFFIGKVASIRNKLSDGRDEDDVLLADIKFDGEPLVTIAPVTSDEVKSCVQLQSRVNWTPFQCFF